MERCALRLLNQKKKTRFRRSLVDPRTKLRTNLRARYCTVVHDGLAEGFDFGDMRSRVETMFESQEVEVEWDE